MAWAVLDAVVTCFSTNPMHAYLTRKCLLDGKDPFPGHPDADENHTKARKKPAKRAQIERIPYRAPPSGPDDLHFLPCEQTSLDLDKVLNLCLLLQGRGRRQF